MVIIKKNPGLIKACESTNYKRKKWKKSERERDTSKGQR
jgi:hypothetical protein